MSSKLPAAAIGAWLLVAVYYFYQYALRSAPSVMMPQLTGAFGMAGGSAGQFLVGPMMKSGLAWNRFWLLAGIVGLLIAAALLILLPKETGNRSAGGFAATLRSLGRVFRNPQSILCGVISGLL